LQVDNATYDRAAVAEHANGLATKIRSNLTNSLTGLGVEILEGNATILVSSAADLLVLLLAYGQSRSKFAFKRPLLAASMPLARTVLLCTRSITRCSGSSLPIDQT
jgi:hypothetical protein